MNQRKNKLTNLTKKQKFLEALKLTKCNISKSCKAINISRVTYYEWIKKYPKFAQEVQEIEDSLTDRIENALFRKAELGHQRAIEFYLTNRKKDKYSNTVKKELTGANKEPLNIIIEKTYYSEREDIEKDKPESSEKIR